MQCPLKSRGIFFKTFFLFGGLWKLLSQKFRSSWVSDKIMQKLIPLMMKMNWSELWPLGLSLICILFDGVELEAYIFCCKLWQVGKLILNWSFYCLVAQCTRLWRSRLRWRLQNGNALEEIGSIISPTTTFSSMDPSLAGSSGIKNFQSRDFRDGILQNPGIPGFFGTGLA